MSQRKHFGAALFINCVILESAVSEHCSASVKTAAECFGRVSVRAESYKLSPKLTITHEHVTAGVRLGKPP